MNIVFFEGGRQNERNGKMNVVQRLPDTICARKGEIAETQRWHLFLEEGAFWDGWKSGFN